MTKMTEEALNEKASTPNTEDVNEKALNANEASNEEKAPTENEAPNEEEESNENEAPNEEKAPTTTQTITKAIINARDDLATKFRSFIPSPFNKTAPKTSSDDLKESQASPRHGQEEETIDAIKKRNEMESTPKELQSANAESTEEKEDDEECELTDVLESGEEEEEEEEEEENEAKEDDEEIESTEEKESTEANEGDEESSIESKSTFGDFQVSAEYVGVLRSQLTVTKFVGMYSFMI